MPAINDRFTKTHRKRMQRWMDKEWETTVSSFAGLHACSVLLGDFIFGAAASLSDDIHASLTQSFEDGDCAIILLMPKNLEWKEINSPSGIAYALQRIKDVITFSMAYSMFMLAWDYHTGYALHEKFAEKIGDQMDYLTSEVKKVSYVLDTHSDYSSPNDSLINAALYLYPHTSMMLTICESLFDDPFQVIRDRRIKTIMFCSEEAMNSVDKAQELAEAILDNMSMPAIMTYTNPKVIQADSAFSSLTSMVFGQRMLATSVTDNVGRKMFDLVSGRVGGVFDTLPLRIIENAEKHFGKNGYDVIEHITNRILYTEKRCDACAKALKNYAKEVARKKEEHTDKQKAIFAKHFLKEHNL